MLRAQEIPKLLGLIRKISFENLVEKLKRITNAQIPREIKEGDGTHWYNVISLVVGILAILVIILTIVRG